MRALLAITKALSDANRVRILCALWERGELCVCQIQELLGLAPSTTSKHLSILASAGLVDVRKEARWAYYRIVEEEDAPAGGLEMLQCLIAQAAEERAIGQDRETLDAILSYSPEELCDRQAKGKTCCVPAGRGRTRKAPRGRK